MKKRTRGLNVLLAFLVLVNVVSPTLIFANNQEVVKVTNSREESAVEKKTADKKTGIKSANEIAPKITDGGTFFDTSTGIKTKYFIPDNTVLEVAVGGKPGSGDDAELAIDSNSQSEVKIPATITYKNLVYAVTSVGDNAFKYANASKIILPDSILKIGAMAFRGAKLTNAPNLKNVESIGKHAFYGVVNVSEPFYITDKVTFMGTEVFRFNSGQQPESLTIYFDFNGSLPWDTTNDNINLPFYALNTDEKKVVILKNKEKYEEAIKKDSRMANTSTYELDLVFRDRSGNELSIPRRKVLYYDRLWIEKKENNTFIRGANKNAGVNTLPNASDFGKDYTSWSPSILGRHSIAASSAYYPLIGALTTTSHTLVNIGPDISDELGKTISLYPTNTTVTANNIEAVFNNNPNFIDFNGTLDGREFTVSKDGHSMYNGIYLYTDAGDYVSGKKFTGKSHDFTNVAQSGKYKLQLYTKMDAYYGYSISNLLYQMPTSSLIPVEIKITPADIVINPPESIYIGAEKQADYALPNLNEILGKENDTQGTYTWDNTTPPSSWGTHAYSYTFVPDNLYGKDSFNNATNIANYKELSKTGTVNLVYSAPNEIKKIELNKNKVKMDVGNNEQLSVSFHDAEATGDRKITWKSSDEDVATVNEYGKIISKLLGKATITATTKNGKTATCNVYVVKDVESISLDHTDISLDVGKEKLLTPTITPKEAIYEGMEFTWKSSNEDIATVDKTGKVSAKKEGVTTITITSENGKTATCKVNVVFVTTTVPEDVEKYPEPPTIPGTDDDIKDQINEIFETKKKYESLPTENKKEIEYDIVEKLNELLRSFDEVKTNVIVGTKDEIRNASAKNLAEALDKADVEKLIAGTHKAVINLYINNVDENNVSQGDADLIEKNKADWETANFVDIKLIKTIMETISSIDVDTLISEVAQPIKVKMDIPNDIKGKKEYAVLRIHNNVVTELKDEDSDPNTITFLSDRFSTYNIVYKEKDIEMHDVVFDFVGGVSKDGTASTMKITVENDNLITKYPNENSIKKDGFIFAGWYTNKNYEKKWDFNSDKVTANMTLYAKWDKAKDMPSSNPDTGDHSNANLYLMMGTFAFASILIIYVKTKNESKRKKNKAV